MTTTAPGPVPMTALTAVLDELTQWLARHGAHPTYCTVSTDVYPSIDMSAHQDALPPDILEALGLTVSHHFISHHEVHAVWDLTVRTTTGVQWDIGARVTLGSVKDWGHLIDEETGDGEL